MLEATKRIRERLGGAKITQDALALMMGYDRSHVSRVLNDLLPATPQFLQKAEAALLLLEQAEEAAAEARERVLHPEGK